ncbi:hypothetical protein CC86DRAFT_367140 [Ophiobolus disseminans]|uniref:Glyoxalase-like domain-containing protein n=1 Tax=Ophiobolus disseminans TaxID=1469910 RepID=A0A6A7ACD3_9PLEO|nr:hypothetical protein CC86DRAFT_367140 [Ophiobolus disseminans]
MSPKQSLDHLILFVPANPDTKLPHLPPFFKENFTLTPGGFHAGGATSNTLILLADGCYIELISFIDDSQAASHWWGPDADFVGWKDWCLTNSKSPDESYADVKESHDEPVHGGRKRADGVEVKWAVTFPKGEKGGQDVRGRIPFFCHDTTPRNTRVPLSVEKTTHPCGALGVQQLTIIVKDRALLDETRQTYAAVLGDEGIQRGDEIYFQAGRVCEVEGLESRPKLVLRLPKDKKEFEATMKTGFQYDDVVLGVPSGASMELGARKRLDVGEVDVRGLWVEYI